MSLEKLSSFQAFGYDHELVVKAVSEAFLVVIIMKSDGLNPSQYNARQSRVKLFVFSRVSWTETKGKNGLP